jgi:hypothetical protein
LCAKLVVPDGVPRICNLTDGVNVPMPTLLVVVMVDVVIVDVAFIELTFKVEYAATPGAPLLMLETVRVDRVRVFDVILDPDRVE